MHRGHDHDHSHGHGHAHSHDHDHHHDHGGHHHHHSHGPGHNHAHDAEHLHSHVHADSASERIEELKTLSTAFIEGFRAAADKTSYLRLAGIPFRREGADGLAMHLVDTAIASNWQIGTASPAFGSRELVYLPYPGGMVTARETMTFTYVSLTQRMDIDLSEILASREDT
ncbi:MAG: hypothetical protein R3D43_14640 [Tepidamorphaceae bacterium]